MPTHKIAQGHERSARRRASVTRFLASTTPSFHLPSATLAIARSVLLAAIVRHVLLGAFHAAHISALVTAGVFLFPEITARLLYGPAITATLFVWRTAVVSVLLTVCISSAALLVALNRPWESDTFTIAGLIPFLLAGLFVGAAIRSLFVKYLEKAIEGVSTEVTEATLLGIVAAYLFLFPTTPSHQQMAAPYLTGVAAGFLAHFVSRTCVQGTARRGRMRRNLLALLDGPNGPSLQRRELDAIECYVYGSWARLRSLVEENSARMTLPLVIVEAAADRFNGEYAKALASVNRAIELFNPADDLIKYLYLIKALCLSDLGTDHDGMFQALDEVLRRDRHCVLGRVTWALRVAEETRLSNDSDLRAKRRLQRAHVCINRAMRLAQGEGPSFWALTVGLGVPVTWTFLLDGLAYVVFCTGQREHAKALLLHCTRNDPKFASPYLHLGEFYLSSPRTGLPDEVVRANRRRALVCLHIAVRLEGDRNSLIRRRAQGLIDSHEREG